MEEAIKKDPAIFDCLVVGLPDEKFGQRVVAVASFKEGEEVDEATLKEETRAHLAGYKLPKQIFFVPKVERAANGKADYKWAEQAAAKLAG